MSKPSVNSVILNSIPLNRKMKRYWIAKFERIVHNCGSGEAIRKFKNLRVQIMTYLADPCRRDHLDSYYANSGFRKNGYLRMLFEYADTQPHFVLNFLKLYTGLPQPHKDEREAQTDHDSIVTHNRLANIKSQSSVPCFLEAWLECVFTRPRTSWELVKEDPRHPFYRLASNLKEYSRWKQYWGTWYRILKHGWHNSAKPDFKPVWPEIYKDFVPEQGGEYIPGVRQTHQGTSKTYKMDFACLVSMHLSDSSPLDDDDLEYVDSMLSDDMQVALQRILWGEDPGVEELANLWSDSPLVDGQFVGWLQHILKKGSPETRRDIAVPVRFVQNALVPCADRLYNLVRALPKDATFDQNKFDTMIQGRVNNPNLYQGSVDLHKATDNLPFSWGEAIVEKLTLHLKVTPEEKLLERLFGPEGSSTPEGVSESEFQRSYRLFQHVSRAPWYDNGFLTSWTVGQPLGSYPSFAMLAITHNFFIESLAASMGYSHSPYVILGDDIVVTNKRLRERYIAELTSRAIPLSLHKSYSGRLSEFAGKVFVHGSVPFYCSDHNPITWNALFDYQRVTGIRIPWKELPKAIRRKAIKLTEQVLLQRRIVTSTKNVAKLARYSYDVVLSCEITGRGSHLYPLPDKGAQDYMVSYFEYLSSEDEASPDPEKSLGITQLGNGRPVILMNKRFADKDGRFLRFRPVQLPDWYKSKVRPCTTDKVLRAAIDGFIATAKSRPDTA